MGDSPWIINLKNLVHSTAPEKLNQALLDENDRVLALVLAYSEPEPRKILFSLLAPNRKMAIAKILPDLQTPPEFVLQTIYETLKKNIHSSGPSILRS